LRGARGDSARLAGEIPFIGPKHIGIATAFGATFSKRMNKFRDMPADRAERLSLDWFLTPVFIIITLMRAIQQITCCFSYRLRFHFPKSL
jgi:hypothetical protein